MRATDVVFRVLRHRADREILRLAVPALGALAAEPLYVLVDTAVVGHLGTPQLGGLAVAATVLTTAFFLFNFLAYGTTAAVARLLGAAQDRAAAQHAVQALWLAAAAGIALAVAGVTLGPAAIGAFGAADDVVAHAVTYLRISALGAPAVLLALVGVGYLRGLQDVKTTLLIALGSNLVNLVVEVVLIYGFDRGVGASALATVCAQYLAAVVYLHVMVREVRRTGVSWRIHAARLRRIIAVGGALFLRTGSLLAALAVATGVASRMGPVELAAHQIAFQLWSFLALVLDAIAIAGQAMIGRLLGAGDAAGARDAARRMIEWGIAAGLVFAGSVLASRELLAPLFTDDPHVRRVVVGVLVVVALLQPINAIVFVLDGVLIGAGDLRYLAAAMGGSSVLVFLPAALVVHVTGRGLLWLWFALGALMLARLAGNAGRFTSARWQVVGAGHDV